MRHSGKSNVKFALLFRLKSNLPRFSTQRSPIKKPPRRYAEAFRYRARFIGRVRLQETAEI